MIRVSVVVPTYRRPGLLARCLAALDAQDFDPSAFEVLIADDAGSEETRRQVEAFAAASRAAIRYLAGRSAATARRRRGTSAGGRPGETSSRSRMTTASPTPHWLSAGTAAFTGDVAAASGRVIVPLLPRADRLPARRGRTRGGRVRHRQLLLPPRRPRGRRRLRRAVRRRLARGQRLAVRPAPIGPPHRPRPGRGRRPSGPAGPVGRQPPPAAQVAVRRPALQEASGPVPDEDPDRGRRWTTTRWCRCSSLAAVAAGLGWPRTAAAAACGWLALCGGFCARRLRGTSRAPSHVAEMIVTSALIPPLSIYWRLYGAWRFRVPFA